MCRATAGLIGFLVAIGATVVSWSADLQTQTFSLTAGWNLIAFQVVPHNPTPAAVFGSLGNVFEAAWSFENGTKTWQWYVRPGLEQSSVNSHAPIQGIALGRAYWIYMRTAVPVWNVEGSVPTNTPAVSLINGWNLIGVPVGTTQLTEKVNILAVLAASGLDYDTVLRWELDRYLKFTPRTDDVDDRPFPTFDANKGHWVRVTSTNRIYLQPRLLSSVRADVDAEPLGNFPSYEDLDLSQTGVRPRPPLGPTNQTHIVFRPGEDTQQLEIANTGGGIMLWRLEWTPADSTNANWLVFSPSLSQGVTTIENDIVELQLDRRHLPQGTHRGTLKLITTAGPPREFTVVAHVVGLQGEWRGAAGIQSVNERQNPVPDIDLHVSFFEDPAIPGLVRGYIDSQNSLLWPVDVPLVGHITDSSGNAFYLNGAYVLPPGDQNNPPYEEFNTGVDGEDIDWDCNGFDDLNPFPFPIYRAVTLIGGLTSASPASGYTLEGAYEEVVYGMLREPIYLKGQFALRRENSQPFANRRPVPNAEDSRGLLPVIQKSDRPAAPVSVGSSLTRQIQFSTDLVLQDISVEVELGGTVVPTGIRTTLRSPEGINVLLHDRAPVSAAVLKGQPGKGVNFPSERTPAESLATELVQAGARTLGTWRLVVENTTPGLTLVGWSLRLQGQPVFDVHGQLVDANINGIAGATVAVDGLSISEFVTTGSDGSFSFGRLPGIPLNLTADVLGYEPLDPASPGVPDVFRLPQVSTNCMNAAKSNLGARIRPLPVFPIPGNAVQGFEGVGSTTNPVRLLVRPRPEFAGSLRLIAEPWLGYAPLLVDFHALAPPPASGPFGWVYGDGTSEQTAGSSVSHAYSTSRPEGYEARVQVGTSSTNVQVYPMPSPGHTPYVENFFMVHFTSGGTLPPGFAITQDTTNVPVFADLIHVQHAYATTVDLDLAPTGAVGASFDSDGFDPGGQYAAPANQAGNFRTEDYNYGVPSSTNRFAGEWSLAADCDYLPRTVNEDNIRDPHSKPGASGDCANPRYIMLCSLGPQVLPLPNSEVIPLSTTTPPYQFLPSVPDPLTDPSRRGIAQSRDYRLITGPLAEYWTPGGAQ